MLRADRLLLGALALFAVLIVFTRRSPPETQAAPEAELTLETELLAFREELDSFRNSDEGRLAALSARAERLCQRWMRCDAREIVRYYAQLDPAQRQQGLQLEQRYQALRTQLAQAASLEAAAWPAERARLFRELELLAQQADLAADGVPAARVHALMARLYAEEPPPRDDSSLRQDWIENLRAQLDQAQVGFVRAGMLRPRIELDWIRARLLCESGEVGRAERAFEECLDNARALNDREWQQRALEELYTIAENAGDLARLRRLLDELALLAQAQGRPADFAVSMRHALQLIWQDHARAAEDFLRQIPTALTGREAEQRALLLGQALARQGRFEAAREQWASIASGSPFSSEARLSEAQADLAQGSVQAALSTIASHAPAAQASVERRAAWRTLRAEAFLAAHKPESARRDLELALTWIQNEERAFFDGRDPLRSTNLFGEVLGLHAIALLAESWVASGDALQAACVIESAQARRLRAGQALARGDLAAWAARFDRGLVTWVIGADHALVVTVDAQGNANAERIPHGRRVLREAVRRLREAVLSAEDARSERLARELASALLPEASAARLFQGSGRVLFLLHGPLEALPVECFENGTGMHEGIVPVVLPGLAMGGPPSAWQPQLAQQWQLCGDPRDSEGQVRLPGAQAELLAIERIVPRSVTLRAALFERTRLIDALRSEQAVHIATHLIPGSPDSTDRFDASGLELDGGERLTTLELAQSQARSPLVVLAACSSGGGRFEDGEGLQGPARALLENGVPRLIVTLWPVEDRWAQAFSEAFHRQLQRGLLPSQACAEARRSLRAQGASAADWAAFRALGSD